MFNETKQRLSRCYHGWEGVRNNLSEWRKQLQWIDVRLEERYQSPNHGNLSDPTDELFFILLTKKTPPERYLEVYTKVRKNFSPWNTLLKTDEAELTDILRPLGFAKVRSRQFIRIAEILKQDFGSVTLNPLNRVGFLEAKSYLLRLPGVGEKMARCILVYSLGHDISPMDTHATRVLRRFGLLPEECTPIKSYSIMDERVPKGMARRLHVNLVAHGREVCTAKKKRCDVCVLAEFCDTSNM